MQKQLTLDERGDAFSGPFRFEVIDIDGNVLFSDEGSFAPAKGWMLCRWIRQRSEAGLRTFRPTKL